jgi:hypothetical protein
MAQIGNTEVFAFGLLDNPGPIRPSTDIMDSVVLPLECSAQVACRELTNTNTWIPGARGRLVFKTRDGRVTYVISNSNLHMYICRLHKSHLLLIRPYSETTYCNIICLLHLLGVIKPDEGIL